MDGSPIDMGMLPSGTSASNPRAAQVRIEAASASRAGGQRAHDLRLGPQPSYVDADRTHLNRVLIQPWTGVELRRESERRRAQRPTKRAMKSNAGVGIRGIMTFGHEVQRLFEQLSREEQDAAYRELAEAIARRLGTTLTGLVVHADESAPHAHFQLVGYDENGTPISTIAKRGSLRELQDLTAEVMGRHCPGVERGHSKIDRLRGGARPAEVVHWSVAELHDRLPTQIAELRARVAELEDALATAEEKTRKNEALAQKAIAKARAAKTADAERTHKAQRNIEAYERRAHAAREEAQALRGEVDTLEARVGKLDEKAELHAREETRLGEKQRELDRRQAEIDGTQETADAVRQAAETDAAATRRAAEDDAGAIRDKAAGEVLVRTAEIAAHEQTSRDKIARQEHALAKRHAGEDECIAIDRERLTAREAEIAAAWHEAQQKTRRIQQDAERDAAAIEQTRARTETAAANLKRAVVAVANGTHDDEVTREHIPDPVKLDALRAHAPEGRPTWGFWFRFWSLNDARTGTPLALPEKLRSALEAAFDGVARLARQVAALAAREAKLADERMAWEAGQAARDKALADAQAAEARLAEIEAREADVAKRARSAAFIEGAIAHLTSGLAEAVGGTYHKPVAIEDVRDAQQFETLQRHALKLPATRGFRHRFLSLHSANSGRPLPLPRRNPHAHQPSLRRGRALRPADGSRRPDRGAREGHPPEGEGRGEPPH